MNKCTNSNEFFNREAFAEWFKHTRKKAGYKSARAFSVAVKETTGLCLSKDVIYKIESGIQDITVAQLAAFNLVLFSHVTSKHADQAIENATTAPGEESANNRSGLRLVASPFSWNKDIGALAHEDFYEIADKLTYCQASSIGTAIAKLQLLEQQGAKVVEE